MKHVTTNLILAAVVTGLTGCQTLVSEGGDYAGAALNAREQYNRDRLDAEAAQAQTPVIDFRLSHAALQALAQADPATDADGNEIPAIQFTYSPRVEFSGYIEAPYWRLIPSGGELITGMVAGYSLWSSHEIANNRLDVDRELSLREYDSRDNLISEILSIEPIIVPSE